MARNRYFTENVRTEQALYEDIIIESLKIYGQDVYYLPREIVNENTIFGEDVPSRFGSAYKIEMYIENVEGFDGDGDLFTKFGVEIRDQATFVVSRRRWTYILGDQRNQITGVRPHEGDLIYLPLSNSLFQIMHVEHEQPFYQINNLPTYKLRCELFEYNDEDFDTKIDAIDAIEEGSYTQYLQLLLDSTVRDSAGSTNPPDFLVGKEITQLTSSGGIVHGEVVNYNRTTQILQLAHVGGDSGKVLFFEPGDIEVHIPPFWGEYVTRTILSVSENIPTTNQNDEFEVATENEATYIDFLDFSEDNPFGDPR